MVVVEKRKTPEESSAGVKRILGELLITMISSGSPVFRDVGVHPAKMLRSRMTEGYQYSIVRVTGNRDLAGSLYAEAAYRVAVP